MYNISVIGGGISGLTTAYMLQSLGYNTQIISEHFLTDSFIQRPPLFSSLSPAASIIPHSLFGKHVIPTFINSQEVFRELLDVKGSGVNMHLHYELFEDNRDPYDYCEFMDHFEPIDQKWESLPKPNTDSIVSGWRYNCLFADWNVYPAFLMNQYISAGGTLLRKKLLMEDLNHLDSDVIFNCSGLGSIELFGDIKTEVYLGHTIIISDFDQNLLGGKNISYNYEPANKRYLSQKGEVQDVYSYSRSGQILLGGSRLAGNIINGQYSGDGAADPIISQNDISMSAQIYELNKEIIQGFYGIDLDNFPNREFRKGFRYSRNKTDGLRLEKEDLNGLKVYHNYGNGGGGVTVSWGAALHVVSLMLEDFNQEKMNIESLVERLAF